MPILAIDTATLVSSVAIADEQKIWAELTLQTKLTHSEVLLPHIQQALAMTQLKMTDITAIAISIGPGSFTGLRIGLATAKSMAYALNIPLVGVSTLAALAYNYPIPKIYIAPILDAQKGNAYVALYQWENGVLNEVHAPVVESFSQILAKGRRLDQPVVFVGEVAVKQQSAIQTAGGNVLPAMLHTIMPRAACVAMLGQVLLSQGLTCEASQLEPLYIRRSEAEELWERRNQVTK